MSNRRWSVSVANAEPAETDSTIIQPCKGWGSVGCSLSAGFARDARSTDGYSCCAPSGLLPYLGRYLCLEGKGVYGFA